MPFNIDPQTLQKLLFGGPQAAMMPQDPTASAPQAPPAAPPAPAPLTDAQPPSSTPPRGSVAEAMPQQQQAPTAAAPPSTPPQNAPIPQAPQPYHHGTLAKIMLGIGEALGNPLATRIGERDRGRQQEVDEYTRNLPTAQYQANVTQQKNTADLEHTRAQTHLEQVQAEIAQQNLPLQEQAQKHYEALLKAWQERATPDFDSYAHSYLAGLPDAIRRRLEPHLEEIKQTPQTGKDSKINMQDDMPVSIESYGKTYLPDEAGKFGPEVPAGAVQEFTAAQQTHKTKRGEKLADQKEAEGAAAARQGASFAQSEKMFQEHQDALTSATKSMIESAPGVLALSARVRQLVDKQEKSLGPAASRWNEFMAGKVGAPNPEFTRLRTDIGLLSTKLMRMHVGARGGELIMQHFKDLIDSGKQSPENLKAALDEIDQYAKETAAERPGGQQQGAAPAPGNTSAADPLGIR